MIKAIFCTFLLVVFLGSQNCIAQSTAINYQVRYDEPYNINKLFAHFQPIYGEVAASNMSIGFGFEFDYYLENKMDFNLQFRKSYSQAMDLMRDAAVKNGLNSIDPSTYKYLELGGTYHWRDFEEEKPTKVFLYAKRYKGTAWASRVIQTTEVVSKVRRVYGGRLGGLFHTTVFDLNRLMDKQGIVLEDAEGNSINTDASLFGNLSSSGVYVGASMAWIRNFAIDFEQEYEPGGDDLLLTAFFDILVAPYVDVENIDFNGISYSTDPLKLNRIGFRFGAKGKFNRDLGWGYGVELGFRPGVNKQGFFSVLKLSFPLHSTDLSYSKVESVEINDNQ